ncbi:MAG: ribonuclease R [Bacteroidota bacterium]|jgi:ribonuclease R
MKRKKNKAPKKNYLFEEVFLYLKKNAGRSYNYKQIAAALSVEQSDKFRLIEILDALSNEKQIVETERGKYQVIGSRRVLTGVIDFTSAGDAYVNFSDEEPDVFVAGTRTKNALQGDTVKISLKEGRGKRSEAEVTEVVIRNKTEFVGILQSTPRHHFVIPVNNKIHIDFFILPDKTLKAKNGEKVLVRMIDWSEGDKNPSAEIIKVFGNPGDHQTEIHAIMAEYGLQSEFPAEVEDAAQSLSVEITEDEISKRRDFREVLTFTIDPHDAKDFDDALSFKRLNNGSYEIGVHIADVSHYLHPGTTLEEEAIKRATSVYLVDRTVPMLPEVLSNFACSLRPKEQKLTFSAVFEMNDKGEILNEWFGRTVIYSDRRFTYEEVQNTIETKVGEYSDEILLLDSLAKKMRAERAAKGSVFFDKEEVKFHLDETGSPTGVYFKKQLDAHKLIEDFMLLANRKVAELLGKPSKEIEYKKNAMVYRVHDTPNADKMNALSELVGKFGYKMNLKTKRSVTESLNSLLKNVSGKKEAGMIELLAVRSMPKAIYTTKNIGHYGLGFEYYTHFTSPIRRYPDVLAHRLLAAYLEDKNYSNEKELEELCKQSSEMEKLAAEAERESVKFKQVEYMEQFVGQKFKGMISGVTDWGIYVEIQENKCEGMVSVRDMKDDYYRLEEENFRFVGQRSGKIYALGDFVWIEVRKADILKRRLDFVFVKKQEDSINKIIKSHSNSDDFSDWPIEKSVHQREGGFPETNSTKLSGSKIRRRK